MIKMNNSKGLTAYLTIEIRDNKGRLKSSETVEANSYVKAIMDLLYTCMCYTGLAGEIDIGGVSRTTLYAGSSIANHWRVDSAAGDLSMGIIAGTGTNAVAITDYSIQTIINHGNTANLLYYNATNVIAPTTSGTTRSFQVQRVLTNNSAGQITIKELALYCKFPDSAGGIRYFCLDHSLYTKAVPAANTATVTYTIGVTV